MKNQKENFIEKAIKKHGTKYNYDKVIYKGCKENIVITCPIHGDFEQTPSRHLNTLGCPECSKISRVKNKKKISLQDFITRSNNIHSFKYDYSKVSFNTVSDKVTIICPEHGEFEQTVYDHMGGHGCFKCGVQTRTKNQTITTEEFIKRASEIHNNYYSYEHSVYTTSHNKIIVTCPIHGDVEIVAMNHLKGSKCPKCLGRNLTTKEWIEKASKIHNNKYDYSKVEYVSSKTKVTITCPIHGDFEQSAGSHLQGRGCKKCGLISTRCKKSKTTEDFIKECNIIHNNKYDYSKVNYINKNEYVTIICPEHGEFKQIANSHLRGHGCQYCKESRGEKLINNYLKSLDIEYIRQYPVYIKNKNIQVDFMVNYNNKIYFIEYNGRQHYESVEYFGGEKSLQEQQYRDSLLFEYCINENIEFIEIPYTYSDEMIIKKLKILFNNE